MTGHKMDLQTFKNYLDIYSADFSRWPVTEVHAALTLIAENEAARACFDADLQMDNDLRAAHVPDMDLDGIAARIVAAIDAPAMTGAAVVATVQEPARQQGFLARGGLLLAAAFAGFMTGFMPPVDDGSHMALVQEAFFVSDTVIAGDADIYDGSVF